MEGLLCLAPWSIVGRDLVGIVVVDLVKRFSPRTQSLVFIVLDWNESGLAAIRIGIGLRSHLLFEIYSSRADQIDLIVSLLHRRRGIAAHHDECRRICVADFGW